ncbi:MAG: glycosyltransferase [Pseudomonadota bacterium]
MPQPEPPIVGQKGEMAFVICSNANWFWQGVFLLHRAAELNLGKNIDFYYYSMDPLADHLQPLLPNRATFVQWSGKLPKPEYGLLKHVTEETVLRIFAIGELCQSYDRVLYLDIDMFLRWGDLADLLSLPLGSYPMAAVLDISLWPSTPKRWFMRNYMSRYPENMQRSYFNAGFILANGPAWADNDITARAARVLSEDPKFCHFGDQSALNAVVAGHWLELSPGWNWQANVDYDFMIPMRNPRIVHFLGRYKAWSDVWFTHDEIYIRSIMEWLHRHELKEEIREIDERVLSASSERRRTRELSRTLKDPMAMRESVKGYLDLSKFADFSAGIKGFGWKEDR